MALETLNLEHLPSDYEIVLGFYRNVKNAKFLHEQLLARNSEFEYAFIDASVIFSRLQILSAAFKATTADLDSVLKTPNVHSEIVVSLTPSNNISEAYRRFGVSPNTKDLIVVKVLKSSEQPSFNTTASSAKDSVLAHLEKNVEGTLTDLTEDQLSEVVDLPKVSKYYKLNGLRHLDKMAGQARRREMESVILAGMALRGV